MFDPEQLSVKDKVYHDNPELLYTDIKTFIKDLHHKASHISLNFWVTENPPPPGNSNPFCGGVWIFSEHAHNTVIKHNRHLRTWGNCRKTRATGKCFPHFSSVLKHQWCFECDTWLRLLYLLTIKLFVSERWHQGFQSKCSLYFYITGNLACLCKTDRSPCQWALQ